MRLRYVRILRNVFLSLTTEFCAEAEDNEREATGNQERVGTSVERERARDWCADKSAQRVNAD